MSKGQEILPGVQPDKLNAVWRVWRDHQPEKIDKTQFTIQGFSIAALRTNFFIKELGIMLDAGCPINSRPEKIFITHPHPDHIASLPFHLYSSSEVPERIQIYVHSSHAKHLEAFLSSTFMLCTNNDYELGIYKHCEILPVEYGDIFEMKVGKRKFVSECIRCFHSRGSGCKMPCVGYGLSEKVKRLRQDHRGKDPKEISALVKNGVTITDEIIEPFLLFLGDTDERVLENKEIEKYPTVMIECTFLMEEDIPQAREKCHMHIKYLEPYIRSHPTIKFILYHFSQKYSRTEIFDFFKALGLLNASPWVNN